MEKIKVSVIIPVYKPGELIHDCVNSLINQTLTEIEFIFVNDGSPDNVLDILQEYQTTDKRIKIISQENQGASIARNTGLDIAKGEYIGFIDSDDYYELDFVENLYNNAIKNDLDIIVSRTIEGRDRKKLVKESIFPTNRIFNTNDEFIKNLLLDESLFAVWNKLYKHSFLKNFNIRFPKNRDAEEDCAFNLQAFTNSKSIMFINYYGYHYREVLTSESRRFIERDMFSKALDKFSLDYKNIYSLKIEKEEVDHLKSIRLINRSIYLVFICSIDKSSFTNKYNYIKTIITNPILKSETIKYKNDPLLNNGLFDKIIRLIIINQSLYLIKVVILLFHNLYNPKISEFLRFINGNKKDVQVLKYEN